MKESSKILDPFQGGAPDMVFDMSGEPVDEKVSIIIVHRNNPEYLNILLQSIIVTSVNNNFEIIVVDDNSDTKDALLFLEDLQKNSQGDVKVIRNSDNGFFPKCANIGARAANPDSKYFIFMHHDVVVLDSAWIDFMLNAAETESCGLVGMSTSKVMVAGKAQEIIDDYCFMVSRDCYKDAGPFCEELPAYGSSYLFSLASHLSDNKPQTVKNKLVHHYEIMSYDISDLERFTELSYVLLPKKMNELFQKWAKK